MPEGLSGSWGELWSDFEILRRSSLSRHTLANYSDSLLQLSRFLGPEVGIEDVTRRQIVAFLEWVGSRTSPGTAAMRYRGLSAVFGWLARADEDGEARLALNPMKGLRPPRTDLQPVPVLALADAQRVLATCRARPQEGEWGALRARRDEAMIRFLYDTGCRRGEVASMRDEPSWLNLREGTAMVTGKTGPRVVAFGNRTAAALLRYLRLRRKLYSADSALWVGQQGVLRGNGIYQAIARRFELAEVEASKLVHLFRHTFSHEFRLAGGQLDDLVALNGWSGPAMALRYGRSAAAERARQAHRRLSIGERL